MRHALIPLACCALIATPALADDESRSADAHEHGHGTLNVAIDGDTVEIELEAPSYDVMGFEGAPTNQDQIDAQASAARALRDPRALFGIAEAAGCNGVDADIEMTAAVDDDHDHGDEHEHDEEQGHDEDHAKEEAEAEHSEVHATYRLTCSDAGAVTAIDASGYFEAFPNAQELDAAVLSDAGQKGGELERDEPVLEL